MLRGIGPTSACRQPRVVGAALGLVLVSGIAVAAVGVAPDPPPLGIRHAGLGLDERALTAAPPAAPQGSRARPPRPPSTPPAVRALARVRIPDLLVTVRTSLRAEQVRALDDLRQVEGVSALDVGTVRIGGKGARLVGVDPSVFRQFTPSETASSDALWAAVARGELAATYALSRARKLRLGSTVEVVGTQPARERVGALAVFGLPGIDAVTDRATARALGIVPASAILVSAPGRSIGGLRRDVRAIVGKDADVEVLRPATVRASKRRPASYRELYQVSARYCPGLRWQVLAAIGQVESGHGRNNGPSSAGALGPMQFLPSTWAAYGVDGDGDGRADIMSAYDAVPSAALYLCRNGAGRGGQSLYDAIFAYNHADWYVRKILALADAYR
ncbi:MAG TPA: lytic murein transglycosylase [Mycobacteriales bacterium]|nr:lytic murein transglycosylase [Mycobacteriales bacterium]